jgi:hypothetical protein
VTNGPPTPQPTLALSLFLIADSIGNAVRRRPIRSRVVDYPRPAANARTSPGACGSPVTVPPGALRAACRQLAKGIADRVRPLLNGPQFPENFGAEKRGRFPVVVSGAALNRITLDRLLGHAALTLDVTSRFSRPPFIGPASGRSPRGQNAQLRGHRAFEATRHRKIDVEAPRRLKQSYPLVHEL